MDLVRHAELGSEEGPTVKDRVEPIGSPHCSMDRDVAEQSGGRIQLVEACAARSSVNTSLGFFQSWILRGRSLISAATAAR